MLRFVKRNLIICILVVVMLIPIAFVVIIALAGVNADERTFTFRKTIEQMGISWNPNSWNLSIENEEYLERLTSPLYRLYETLDDDGNPVYVDGNDNPVAEGQGLVRSGYHAEAAASDPVKLDTEMAIRVATKLGYTVDSDLPLSSGNDYGLQLLYRYKLDEEGNPIKDEDGNPIPELDDDGKAVLDTDSNGYPQLIEAHRRRAYRVPIRNDLRWQTGEFIEIEEFYWSLKELLSPQRKLYRAENYYSGVSSLVGAKAYYDQSSATSEWQNNGSWDAVGVEYIEGPIGSDPVYTSGSMVFVYEAQAPEDREDLLVRYDSTFLTHRPTVEANQVKVGNLVVSSYNTSLGTTMSYGPYKMVERSDNTVIFERNRYWGTTRDGEEIWPGAYQPTHVRLDLGTSAATNRLQFLNGELDYLGLTSSDLDLRGSSQRRDVLSSFSMRLYFNGDREALEAIQADGSTLPSAVHKPTNLQFFANDDFRKAISLSMNRINIAQAYGPASIPSTVLWNEAYFNTFSSTDRQQYRYTNTALSTILEREGVDTTDMSNIEMREAFNKLDGFNAQEATRLFSEARKYELGRLGRSDSDELVVVNFTIYTGTATNVSLQQAAINQVQASLDAATPPNLKINMTLRAQPAGDKTRYTLVDEGQIESIFGAFGGATVNITSPLTTFLGLSNVYNNGNTYGLNPAERDVTIDVSELLKYPNPEVVNLIQPIYEENKDEQNENKLTLKLNQWGTLFGASAKPTEPASGGDGSTYYDDVDYSFLPKVVSGNQQELGKSHALVGSWARKEFLEYVMPHLEVALLDLHLQIPVVMDYTAKLISFRSETLLRNPDPILETAGTMRFYKITKSDGEWAREVASHREDLRILYFL
ncbi:MAG: ABC transporter substrate-binding protein [Firmicutes bacterium]|nr:ABC transporter substrate-binding protein [Bacillota bacterium]MCL1954219.1 ABC transporter substrate-binding protein [Bacillota bacterium]